jgi:hypothetical protein
MKIDIGINNLNVIVETEDILPCPCCGSSAFYRREAHDYFGHDIVTLSIVCRKCPLSMESDDLFESLDVHSDIRALIDMWNKRVFKGGPNE